MKKRGVFILDSNIYLTLKNGIYTYNKRGGYNFAMVNVSETVNLKMLGKSKYYFSSGVYLWTKNVEFIDYFHFNANQTLILNSALSRNTDIPFNSLNYFDYSTKKGFVAGKWEHHFNMWIFNKIPLFRKLKFQEIAGIASLYTYENRAFSELYFGIENIFNALRIDFVGQYQNKKFNPVLRLGVSVDL